MNPMGLNLLCWGGRLTSREAFLLPNLCISFMGSFKLRQYLVLQKY